MTDGYIWIGNADEWSKVNYDAVTGCIIKDDGTRVQITQIVLVDYNDENDLPF